MGNYSTNQFKPGLKLLIDNEPCSLVNVEFVKPGKGQAFTRVKYRNLLSGRAGLERTFKSGESVTGADVMESDFTFLYKDDHQFHFMNPQTFEQISIDAKVVADSQPWLVEQDTCVVVTWNDQPISVQPPNFVTMRVTRCDPGVKGNTVSGGTKPAEMETGASVRVPLFVNEGDLLKIDTRVGEYVGRAKEDE